MIKLKVGDIYERLMTPFYLEPGGDVVFRQFQFKKAKTMRVPKEEIVELDVYDVNFHEEKELF